MEGLNERIKAILDKVKALKQERDKLRGLLYDAETGIKALKEENDTLRAQVEEKVKSIHILQTANSLNSREDNEEAKKKVDDLLREIEHCLAILDS